MLSRCNFTSNCLKVSRICLTDLFHLIVVFQNRRYKPIKKRINPTSVAAYNQKFQNQVCIFRIAD